MIRFFARKVAQDTAQTLVSIGIGLGINYAGKHALASICSTKESLSPPTNSKPQGSPPPTTPPI